MRAASLPEMRTTPSPPRPGGVEIATIVSSGIKIQSHAEAQRTQRTAKSRKQFSRKAAKAQRKTPEGQNLFRQPRLSALRHLSALQTLFVFSASRRLCGK